MRVMPGLIGFGVSGSGGGVELGLTGLSIK